MRLAEPLVQSDSFYVMNGDSFVDEGLSLRTFLEQHERAGALVSLLVAKPREEKDYGVVTLQSDGRVTGFNEKPATIDGGDADHYLSAGVYLMRKVSDRVSREQRERERREYVRCILVAARMWP